jgi:hypothetical protein
VYHHSYLLDMALDIFFFHVRLYAKTAWFKNYLLATLKTKYKKTPTKYTIFIYWSRIIIWNQTKDSPEKNGKKIKTQKRVVKTYYSLYFTQIIKSVSCTVIAHSTSHICHPVNFEFQVNTSTLFTKYLMSYCLDKNKREK